MICQMKIKANGMGDKFRSNFFLLLFSQNILYYT